MKCTRLFPCSTTNPKGVKAKNAAFPDTSCKATAAPQQSAATVHPQLYGGLAAPLPQPRTPSIPRRRAAASPRGPTNSQSMQQAVKMTVPNQFLLLIIKQENGKNLLDL